jgi:hypothetical protein
VGYASEANAIRDTLNNAVLPFKLLGSLHKPTSIAIVYNVTRYPCFFCLALPRLALLSGIALGPPNCRDSVPAVSSDAEQSTEVRSIFLIESSFFSRRDLPGKNCYYKSKRGGDKASSAIRLSRIVADSSPK